MNTPTKRVEVSPGVWVYQLRAVAKRFEAAKAMLEKAATTTAPAASGRRLAVPEARGQHS